MKQQLAILGLLLGWLGVPSLAPAQFKTGDRLLIVKQDAEVCKNQEIVEKFPKGRVVTAREIQPAEDGSWIKIDRGADTYGWIHEDNLSRDGVTAVRLDEVRTSKVLKADPAIRIARGTTKVVEDTIRVRHSITISDKWKYQAGVKTEVKAGVFLPPLGPVITTAFAKCETDIRMEIEKTTGQQFGIETERKRSVTIDGDKVKNAVKVVWREHYRTGTTNMLVNGGQHDIPFEYREDFDLITEEVGEPVASAGTGEPVTSKSTEPTGIELPSRETRIADATIFGSLWVNGIVAALSFLVGCGVGFAIALLRRRPSTPVGTALPVRKPRS